MSSINGAMVGTQAAIMTEFDSMLCVLVSSVFCIRGVIGYWLLGEEVPSPDKQIGRGICLLVSFLCFKGQERTAGIFGVI